MKILVTNDDGVFAEGLWTLVKELQKVAQVVVVAPDREQSAIGTAVSLRQPLRVQSVRPLLPGVETFSVQGTPADSVILALSKLVEGKVDMVVSGINDGLNLGDDVLISGTVSGALQGYLRGFPALAISKEAGENGHLLEGAARVAALLARATLSRPVQSKLFLNVNLPTMPLEEVKGARITRLAHYSHIDTAEEGTHSKWKHYWLVRQKQNVITEKGTDMWAIDQGYISITPLQFESHSKTSFTVLESMCADLLQGIQKSSKQEAPG
ncbi:MAG: 5'/3'-nucleotidase SurE [Chloroflexi bacterium]|nr:5'/3'-nucleotidase SurE [Chloroflexota bacterium]